MPADELPSGTITLLFTDIEGSTRLVQLLGDRYGELLADHRRLLRTAFAGHAGHEIDTQGDAFFIAFPSAKDAVAAAVDAQIALAGHAWPDGAQVRVRMGVHTGEPALGEEGYHGLGLHRGARICSAGHGGQILLSNATRELIVDERIDGVELLDLGEKRLKDIDRPERITQVDYPGMPAVFPPLKTVDAQPLDAPFEGHEEALAAAVATRFGWARRRRSRGTAIVAAVVVVAVAGAVAATLSGNAGHEALASLAENYVGRIDPGGAKLTEQYPVGDGPHALAAGAGSLWAANTVDGTVTRIDRSGGHVVTTTIPVGDDTSGIAFGEGTLWVTDRQDRTLSQISPKSNRLVNSIPLRDVPAAIAVAPGAVWIASDADRSVVRLDVASGTFSRPVELGAAPGAIAAGSDAVWLASEGGTVFRIEPREGVVGTRSPSATDPSPWPSARERSGRQSAGRHRVAHRPGNGRRHRQDPGGQGPDGGGRGRRVRLGGERWRRSGVAHRSHEASPDPDRGRREQSDRDRRRRRLGLDRGDRPRLEPQGRHAARRDAALRRQAAGAQRLRSRCGSAHVADVQRARVLPARRRGVLRQPRRRPRHERAEAESGRPDERRQAPQGNPVFRPGRGRVEHGRSPRHP